MVLIEVLVSLPGFPTPVPPAEAVLIPAPNPVRAIIATNAAHKVILFNLCIVIVLRFG